ncbi:hypothetical protein CspeluHIS016_0112550 [Cutaneotrichosporon spelunceum]|uniref:N-acetyl-D-glucosamine kinase n=1 Tax=Cutaneotrichosporon spelunceum TaxID=1672016 RepID=A0AAD3YAF6_9TREE|nr:hypothetical protein CspeluHIS016_0112550 [Cutaneotrichosporon spelunceum]
MSYYLCIDGGGTKTSAFIASVSAPTVVAVGHAGPSNLTFGLNECLAATRAAVRNALTELRNTDLGVETTFPHDGVCFERVWAAYAGCTRQSDRDALLPPLQEMFGDVRLTGDGELLTAPALGGPPQRFVTLICGTGSLALLWEYNGRGAEQLARSGGWGPLLDDAGSGWALGKEAVKSVLMFAANKRDLRTWHGDVLAHFGLDRATGADRLIAASSQLDPVLPSSEADAERKKRIAGCSRIVVAAAEGDDDEALRLLGVVAEQVCSTLASLVETGRVGDEETMLVVAGGLGQVETFWNQVEARFAKHGWRFRTVKMPEPGRSGLETLLRR